MLIFHKIQRHIEKTDPSGSVVLEMNYDDVSDLCHILWECRKRDMLKEDNEKYLQLEFQNLRHLMVDGQVCEPFEVCSIHEGLELMGWGDEKQGFKVWHDVERNPLDLPKDCGEDWVLVIIQDIVDGRISETPHIAECRSDSNWYLDDPANTRIGSDAFPFKVIKWRTI